MGIAPICNAYIFYSTLAEGSKLLDLLRITLKEELTKLAKIYGFDKNNLSYRIIDDYEPSSYLKEADLSRTYYKKIRVTEISYDKTRMVIYTDALETVFNKLLKLKLINCYYLRNGGQNVKYLFFFEGYSSKLIATEIYAKLYVLAMYRLLDPLSSSWPEFLENIKKDEKIQGYTAKEMNILFKVAQKDPRFKPLLIKSN